MSEGISTSFEKEPTRKEKIIALAVELFQSGEIFPFAGVDAESYSRMKAAEEEDPGYTTPVDEIIERFKNEGMKVVLGKNPQSGNVFVLPAQSSNIEMDSISPGQLQLSEEMNEKLRELILLVRG
ncbi:MAG: hypothetical protein PHD04_01015 [Candidatus Pacebacteria bacterium]|nr:hypothetical protein [Candidatus Paceibacterota bacterium]